MSRAYEIAVRRSQRRTLHVEDGVQVELGILGVLPLARMRELLVRRLRDSDFDEREDGNFERELESGARLVVDAKKATATLSAARREEVEVSAERKRQVAEEIKDAATREVEAEVERDLADSAAEHERRLQSELTASLERELANVQTELDRLANEVTADGLEERARSLGEVTEVERDEATGEITIRVKV